MANEKSGVSSDLAISLIVTATLVCVLMLSIASVLVYFRRQSMRMAAPRKDTKTVGYKTTINSDKLKHHVSAKIRGIDATREPVNWSNNAAAARGIGIAASSAGVRRCRSTESLVPAGICTADATSSLVECSRRRSRSWTGRHLEDLEGF